MPSSVAAVTFERRHATRTCLRVPTERAGAKPVSHYEYQKSVAKAWLDPDNFGQGPGYHTLSDDSSRGSTIYTMSKLCGGSGQSGSKRSSYISNNSLNPKKGALRRRLNQTFGNWLGTAESDRHGNFCPCQLHQWACGNKNQKNVAHFKECNVTF